MEAWNRCIEYGGAQLLGVNGAVFISHGGSNERAIRNAISAAAQTVDLEVNAHIVQEITKKEQLNNGDNNK